eukprot:Clim_evm123s210 gene=Clim_evmTU123s210
MAGREHALMSEALTEVVTPQQGHGTYQLNSAGVECTPPTGDSSLILDHAVNETGTSGQSGITNLRRSGVGMGAYLGSSVESLRSKLVRLRSAAAAATSSSAASSEASTSPGMTMKQPVPLFRQQQLLRNSIDSVVTSTPNTAGVQDAGNASLSSLSSSDESTPAQKGRGVGVTSSTPNTEIHVQQVTPASQDPYRTPPVMNTATIASPQIAGSVARHPGTSALGAARRRSSRGGPPSTFRRLSSSNTVLQQALHSTTTGDSASRTMSTPDSAQGAGSRQEGVAPARLRAESQAVQLAVENYPHTKRALDLSAVSDTPGGQQIDAMYTTPSGQLAMNPVTTDLINRRSSGEFMADDSHLGSSSSKTLSADSRVKHMNKQSLVEAMSSAKLEEGVQLYASTVVSRTVDYSVVLISDFHDGDCNNKPCPNTEVGMIEFSRTSFRVAESHRLTGDNAMAKSMYKTIASKLDTALSRMNDTEMDGIWRLRRDVAWGLHLTCLAQNCRNEALLSLEDVKSGHRTVREWTSIGQLSASLGSLQKAVSALRTAVTLTPTNGSPMEAMAAWIGLADLGQLQPMRKDLGTGAILNAAGPHGNSLSNYPENFLHYLRQKAFNTRMSYQSAIVFHQWLTREADMPLRTEVRSLCIAAESMYQAGYEFQSLSCLQKAVLLQCSDNHAPTALIHVIRLSKGRFVELLARYGAPQVLLRLSKFLSEANGSHQEDLDLLHTLMLYAQSQIVEDESASENTTANQYRQLAERYLVSLTKSQDSSRFYREKGLHLESQGKLMRAVQAYRSSWSLQRSAELAERIIRCHMGLGRVRDAKSMLKTLTSLCSEKVEQKTDRMIDLPEAENFFNSRVQAIGLELQIWELLRREENPTHIMESLVDAAMDEETVHGSDRDGEPTYLLKPELCSSKGVISVLRLSNLVIEQCCRSSEDSDECDDHMQRTARIPQKIQDILHDVVSAVHEELQRQEETNCNEHHTTMQRMSHESIHYAIPQIVRNVTNPAEASLRSQSTATGSASKVLALQGQEILESLATLQTALGLFQESLQTYRCALKRRPKDKTLVSGLARVQAALSAETERRRREHLQQHVTGSSHRTMVTPSSMVGSDTIDDDDRLGHGDTMEESVDEEM